MRRFIRRAVPLLLAAAIAGVLALAALAGYGAWWSQRTVVLPAPPGPYAVGRRIYDWVDSARLDPFSPGGGQPRELSVWVWYPAAPQPGARPAAYLPPGWARATGATAGLQAVLRTAPDRIRAHAVADAPLSSAAARWPLLVFAPGLGLGVADYTTILEGLASQGFVVAAVDPTYSTDVVLAGGRVVHSVVRARDRADPAQLASLWGGDMRFVADQMQARTGTPFLGRLRPGRVGFFGHSLGGAAATEACKLDARCAGAVDIDGDLVGSVLATGLGKPFLFLGEQGSLAQATPKQHTTQPSRHARLAGAIARVLRGVPTSEAHLLTIAGTGHFSFSDRAVYFWAFKRLGALLGGLGATGGARVLAVTQAYVRAFFNTYLLGSPSTLLSGPSPQYPEVRYHNPAGA